MPKIIDKINERIERNDPFFSLEYFPPRTTSGAVNLIARFDRMACGSPLFIDVTWGAGGGDPCSDKATSSMNIASCALNYCGLETMLHLTCAKTTREEITAILTRAKELGIRNILALRGDAPPGEEWDFEGNAFNYASDLVRHIRLEFGDFFGICVAGYPEGHPDCVSYTDDLRHLKAKVDAGADFIITQLFFEAETHLQFVRDCREIGISCPIVPGVLPIQGYASLRHLTKLSKLTPPQHIVDEVEKRKDDDAAITEYGVGLAVKLCQELLKSPEVPGFHIYTLNREVAAKQILKQVGLWKNTCSNERVLPWKQSANEQRQDEEVRPIYWSARPKSYMLRTRDWDEYPNGRWGDSSSPAFGSLRDYYLFAPTPASKDSLRQQWGEPEKPADVYSVFCEFLSSGGHVKKLPWVEDDLDAETNELTSSLLKLNKAGFLTINSQPPVNGCCSTDEVHGWGGPHGFIYKKAYVEFFCSKSNLDVLLEVIEKYPMMNYNAINRDGSESYNNVHPTRSNAVTWGVFPCKEIIQPTVADPVSFPIWKDEAFDLWKQQWQSLYEEGSVSWNVIQQIHDEYFLVSVVDNNYINSSLFDMFDEALQKLRPADR